MRDQCYICGNGNEEILEQHHIVPRRFGGGDESENTVRVCPNCHSALERLYDKRFYDEIGAEREDTGENVSLTCDHQECGSEETSRIQNGEIEVWICREHKRCGQDWCGRRDVGVVPVEGGGVKLACDKHRTCRSGGCRSTDVTIIRCSENRAITLCDMHAAERGEA